MSNLVQYEGRLTKEEELELGRKIQEMKKAKAKQASGEKITKEEGIAIYEGDEALALLVSNYYNFARDIVWKHHKKTGTKYDKDDLLQDAIAALCEAAYEYDPSKNCKLSTYAFYGITKRVSTTINYQRLVRMPENKMGEYIEIMKAQKVYNELSREEQSKYGNELEFIYATVNNIDKSEIDLILENMQPQVSLNAVIHDGGGELMDIIEDDRPEANRPSEVELDDNVVDIINQLDEYERDLIAFEFGVFPASMSYNDFLEKYNTDDRKVKTDTRRVIRKMRKLAED